MSMLPPEDSFPDAPDLYRLAALRLFSPDLYTREAGTQLLTRLTSPQALSLLEKACKDKESRVVEGALRALLASVEIPCPEAERILLQLLRTNFRVRTLLMNGEDVGLGAVASCRLVKQRFQLLATSPDLAACRLASLTSGSYRRIQSCRSLRLRQNPAFAALFDVIRSDPDLPRSLKTMLSRREAFITRNEEPLTLEPFWGDIRRMTGLLAGLASEPALTTLAQMAIDRTVACQTRKLWEQLRQSIPFVPEVVVGAGPHSANFCSTLATLRPDVLPLVIEKRETIGGQFAAPGGAAWVMNSRSRPAALDRLLRPGKGTALNSLGAYAPVQEADLTGQSYASQERLALATRLSLFVSAQVATKTTYVRCFPNTEATRRERGFLPASPPDGEYLLELHNRETGETGYLTTDTVLFTGGLGEANIAFGDKESRERVERERLRYRQGQSACYATFGEFMNRYATASFPLRHLNEVIVLGGGDSARVVVEALLGYGPENGLTVHTLDRVQRVFWVGQTAKTREQFLACERPRYHLLAGEFPEEGQPDSPSRITPIPSRAIRFFVSEGRASVTTATGAIYRAALVIDCTGFQPDHNAIPRPLARYPNRLRTGSKLRVCTSLDTDSSFEIRCQEVERTLSLLGTPPTVTLSGIVRRYLGRSAYPGSISFRTQPCSESEVGRELERAVQQAMQLPENEPLLLRASVKTPVFVSFNGQRLPVARVEEGIRLYYLGPQSGLPLPDEVLARASKTPENTAALWRYAGEVTAFAEHYFANILRRTSNPTLDLTFTPTELPRSRMRQSTGNLLFPMPREKSTETALIPDSPRRLRYILSDLVRGFRFPEATEGMTFSLRLQYQPPSVPGDTPFLLVETEKRVLEKVSLEPLLRDVGSDPSVQEILQQWGTRRRNPRSPQQAVCLTIAVKKGRCILRDLRQEDKTEGE